MTILWNLQVKWIAWNYFHSEITCSYYTHLLMKTTQRNKSVGFWVHYSLSGVFVCWKSLGGLMEMPQHICFTPGDSYTTSDVQAWVSPKGANEQGNAVTILPMGSGQRQPRRQNLKHIPYHFCGHCFRWHLLSPVWIQAALPYEPQTGTHLGEYPRRGGKPKSRKKRAVVNELRLPPTFKSQISFIQTHNLRKATWYFCVLFCKITVPSVEVNVKSHRAGLLWLQLKTYLALVIITLPKNTCCMDVIPQVCRNWISLSDYFWSTRFHDTLSMKIS